MHSHTVLHTVYIYYAKTHLFSLATAFARLLRLIFTQFKNTFCGNKTSYFVYALYDLSFSCSSKISTMDQKSLRCDALLAGSLENFKTTSNASNEGPVEH